MARFENYEAKKGSWFWMMLTLGAIISEEPSLSVKNRDSGLLLEFLESAFYKNLYKEKTVRRNTL